MPAFDFPNPGTQGQEVTNPTTGITYTYNNGVWEVTGSSVADGYATQAELTAEANARALADSELDVRITAIEDTGAYDPTPIYAAIETEARTRQLADENLQNQIDGIDIDDIDLSDYYTKTEVDAVDDNLQAQIDELATIKGTPYAYTLKDIGLIVASRPGDMYVDNTVVKNIKFISLADEDLNGNERPFGQVGDIVELVKAGGVKYRFEITTAGDGLAGVEFAYAVDEDDLLIAGMTFQVFVYPQNSATASKDYVDDAVFGMMTRSGNQEITPTFRLQEGGYTYVRIQDQKLSLYNVASPEAANHAATMGYVDDTVADYYPLDGEKHITGNLLIDDSKSIRIDKGLGNKQFQIYPANGGGAYGTTLYSFNGGSFAIRLAEDNTQSPYKNILYAQYADNVVGNTTHPTKVAISWLQMPTASHHAANKQYVDDMGQIHYGSIVPSGSEVDDGDLWVDTGNMRLLMRASGAWVNPDREADTTEFKQHATPNGRKFGFSSGTGTVLRKFNYFEDSGLKLRISNTDAFGIKWNDGGITEDVTMTNGPYFTIWEVVDDTNHKIIRQGRISRIDYHASDILCYLSSHRTNGGFSTSKQYWVTIGGII